MFVNCPSPVKITIIDGAPIEAPESDSEEFTYQVREEVMTLMTIMKVKMLYSTALGKHIQLTFLSSGVPFHN